MGSLAHLDEDDSFMRELSQIQEMKQGRIQIVYCRYGMNCRNGKTCKFPHRTYICHRCNKKNDHVIEQCPMNVCHLCNGRGHIAPNCPRRSLQLQLQVERSEEVRRLGIQKTALYNASKAAQDVVTENTKRQLEHAKYEERRVRAKYI